MWPVRGQSNKKLQQTTVCLSVDSLNYDKSVFAYWQKREKEVAVMVSESDGQLRSDDGVTRVRKDMANGKRDRGWGQVIQVCQLSARLHICGRWGYYIEEYEEGYLV